MMKIVVAIVALLFLGVVFASDEDVRCVVYSESCSKCLSRGCGWCEEGFCIGLGSDICPSDKLSQSCPAETIKAVEERQVGVGADCYVKSCDTCAVNPNCTVCVEATTGLVQCSARTDACAIETYYEASYFNDFPLTFAEGDASACFVPFIPPTGVILPLGIFTFAFPAGNFLDTYLRQLIVVLFLTYRANLTNPSYLIRASNIIILTIRTITTGNQREVVYSTAFTLNPATNESTRTLLKSLGEEVGAAPQRAPPGIGTFAYGNGYIDTDGNLILVPEQTSVVNQTVAPSPRGKSNKVLSRGALAGVIIGVFFGALILFLIILFIVLRRRETYPLPFRSPAAAYRP